MLTPSVSPTPPPLQGLPHRAPPSRRRRGRGGSPRCGAPRGLSEAEKAGILRLQMGVSKKRGARCLGVPLRPSSKRIILYISVLGSVLGTLIHEYIHMGMVHVSSPQPMQLLGIPQYLGLTARRQLQERTQQPKTVADEGRPLALPWLWRGSGSSSSRGCGRVGGSGFLCPT